MIIDENRYNREQLQELGGTVSNDFHLKLEAIDNNRLFIIDYIDYIDCLPMIDFHRLGTSGN